MERESGKNPADEQEKECPLCKGEGNYYPLGCEGKKICYVCGGTGKSEPEKPKEGEVELEKILNDMCPRIKEWCEQDCIGKCDTKNKNCPIDEKVSKILSLISLSKSRAAREIIKEIIKYEQNIPIPIFSNSANREMFLAKLKEIK